MQLNTIKNFLKGSLLAATLVLGTGVAHADNISFFGTDTFNTKTTTINFVSASVGVAGNGILSPFNTNSTVTFAPAFNYGVTPSNFQLFSVLAPNGASLIYTINSVTSIIDNLEVLGNGTYTLTGRNGKVSTAMGTFDITTQGSGSLTTFSDINFTTAATPEPNSLMLLGTGFISAAGMLMRRRKMMSA
ncbi:PEP-CTERM sorting domain-containing protein [Terriglobus sp.]|uniref:PEP-CTERM sorting domain-containing protein n=1 Tax=Terriglobus sp. TaxID=1889013 RepID=UPI003AFFBF88